MGQGIASMQKGKRACLLPALASSPQNRRIPLTHPNICAIFLHKSRPDTNLKEESKTQGSPRDPTPRTQRPSPSQHLSPPVGATGRSPSPARQAGYGTSEQRHHLNKPGPVPPSLSIQAMDGPSTLCGIRPLYNDALADTTPLTRAYTPRRLYPRRGIPRVF